ncbi:MAG: hypothetical protein ACTSQE_06440 [Candidatus Heimdallarchaeaceae archaeon]
MKLRNKIWLTVLVSFFISSIAVGAVLSYNNNIKNNSSYQYATDQETGLDTPAYSDTTVDSKLTEEQAIEIAKNSPDIASFIDQFEEIEIYTYYDPEGYWYIDFFALDDWMSYAYAVIDDASGEIVYTEVYLYSEETNLTESEVLDIALANEEVIQFINDNPDYEYYVYYDFYQYWYVDFYGNYYYSWCSVTIDDQTGEIVEVYRSDDFYDTNLNATEVLDIAMSDPDVQVFIEENPDYEVYIYLLECYDAYGGEYGDNESFPATEIIEEPTDNMTLWVVDFSTPDYFEWISIYIDDATGEIVDKWMTQPALLTEDEVEQIVLGIPEVQNFIENYSDSIIDLWYDGFGYWYAWVYSESQWDAYVFVTIDDLTGEVLEVESYFPEPAVHTSDEVEEFVMSLPEVQEYIANYSDYEIWICYSDGYWYVDIYSYSAEYGIWIEIADVGTSGELELLTLEFYEYIIF